MNNIESYLEILEKLKAILERDVKLNRDKLPPSSQVKEISHSRTQQSSREGKLSPPAEKSMGIYSINLNSSRSAGSCQH